MTLDGKKRIVIENVEPEINGGEFPIKRICGDKVFVYADIYADGHDEVSALLMYRGPGDKEWLEMTMRPVGNDRWEGVFSVEDIGMYHYTIRGQIDHYLTWLHDLGKKIDAGVNIEVDLLIGPGHINSAASRAKGEEKKRLKEWAKAISRMKETKEILSLAGNDELMKLLQTYYDRDRATTCHREYSVSVDRKKALFSTWYELFPRSSGTGSQLHGTFKDCEALLPDIAGMGFDVMYLAPIHPIGKIKRKGKNNSTVAGKDDYGSPWAIGSDEGGHKSVSPLLGTIDDFEKLVRRAKDFNVEIAMDIAIQCAPDHPYVKKHGNWFTWRPDGTVQYAENPPKKYEDILPLNFESEEWYELWNELKEIFLFWIDKGIRIFRVDNPHTKPFPFWEWLIREIRSDYPEVIFLAEAFTRPKVMYRLAKTGFTQSYTYITWRNTKKEIIEYLTELTKTEVREYFRPNFWPNTPDILPEHLQNGGRPVFMIRYVIAATLSSNCGIYGPAFELCISDALPGREEYVDSEKYEIKKWDRNKPGNIRDFISRVNLARKENPALQLTNNLNFYVVDNDNILFFGKTSEDLSNIIIVAISLDPYNTQSGWVNVPVNEFGIEPDHPYMVHDLLSDEKYIWQGDRNYVELNPHKSPVHIFKVRKRMRNERDVDYFF
ncbi:MAG: alpha-1,4-glucan--maltose-1-phosphate maltosyltransferase [Nitrospirae bacterium]|nr:alpha-1,4-glucan--maltose-1-phosphate maltosyltransferase [Nitrospirota bacterium]